MPADRYAKPVHVIKVDVIDCASLAVGHDDRLANQLLFGGMQFAEDVYGSFLASAQPTHGRENSAEAAGCPSMRNAL